MAVPTQGIFIHSLEANYIVKVLVVVGRPKGYMKAFRPTMLSKYAISGDGEERKIAMAVVGL